MISETQLTRRSQGAYFDFSVNGTRTIFLSLHNAEKAPQMIQETSSGLIFGLLPNSSNSKPISLLARVDNDEYHVLPNASSIVPIRTRNLDPITRHDVRIIAPMTSGTAVETLQVDGLWIEETGTLLPLAAENHPGIDTSLEGPLSFEVTPRKRFLEVVTDLPGSIPFESENRRNGATREVVGGVLGWEYLLGEMFASDHVTIGMDVRV